MFILSILFPHSVRRVLVHGGGLESVSASGFTAVIVGFTSPRLVVPIVACLTMEIRVHDNRISPIIEWWGWPS